MSQHEAVTFDTLKQELAITGSDQEIYPYLSPYNQAPYGHSKSSMLENEVCSYIRAEALRGHYERRPERLPFTRSTVEYVIENDLSGLVRRYGVLWSSPTKNANDVLYNDGFRSVVSFGTMEFMIRPVQPGAGPGRLHIGAADIMHCLEAALQNNPDKEEMETAVGTGVAIDHEGSARNPRPPVIFEWKLDRANEGKVAQAVQNWRREQFGGSAVAYWGKKEKYDGQFKKKGKKGKKGKGSAPTPAYQGTELRRKKRTARQDTPPNPGPSQKRRTIESQSGTFSSSSSVTSSPEMSSLAAFASPSTPYQQQDWCTPSRLPGPSSILAASPSGPGYPYGSSYGPTPTGPPPGSTRPGSSQSMITGVTRGMSDMALTAPGGYGGPPSVLPPPAGYRPRPVPVQMRHPQPAPGQYEGYGPPPGYGGYPSNAPGHGQSSRDMPPPPIPPQGFPPQGMPPGPPYNPGYYQGIGASPQGGGYPPYPFQGSAEDPQGEWVEDPRAVYLYRGGRQSGSQGPYRGGGGSSRR